MCEFVEEELCLHSFGKFNHFQQLLAVVSRFETSPLNEFFFRPTDRKNHSSVHVVDKRSGFPVEMLQEVAGEMLFTDMNQRVQTWDCTCDNTLSMFKSLQLYCSNIR